MGGEIVEPEGCTHGDMKTIHKSKLCDINPVNDNCNNTNCLNKCVCNKNVQKKELKVNNPIKNKNIILPPNKQNITENNNKKIYIYIINKIGEFLKWCRTES